jgi:hypothetical protein
MPKFEQLNYLIFRDLFLAGFARCSLFGDENFLQVDLADLSGLPHRRSAARAVAHHSARSQRQQQEDRRVLENVVREISAGPRGGEEERVAAFVQGSTFKVQGFAKPPGIRREVSSF